ncbi:MAG: THUMP domain-containing protein, partial [Candidatus Aenigmarchaeota archaeon]|nr:THUMP domain-containing protein [Candidatus Aenigmarchaeota archaeon]
MFTHTLVHYGEIALKGENRPVFEKKLVENIRSVIDKNIGIDRLYGRIVISSSDESVLSTLKNVFGVVHFSPCIVVKSDMEEIKKAALEVAKHANKAVKSFRIAAKRGNKAFPTESMKMNVQVGDVVNEKTGWKVDLENPDFTIFIEVADETYIYIEKIRGPGGLPVGVTGNVVCLLSGGIDSPVAA